MDIQVGYRITCRDIIKDKIYIVIINDARDLTSKEWIEKQITDGHIEILKIERPKYEVIEEKKELLTEEERTFLRQYIKIIENLNNGKFKELLRQEERILIFLNTGITYYIEVGPKFSNMKINKTYKLEELGLEEN